MTFPGALPDPAVLRFDQLETIGATYHLVLSSTQTSCPCPLCGRLSRKVHSRYQRGMADLPISGYRVVITLKARRFFCSAPSCPRRIFCERLPTVVLPAGRRTLRLNEALTHVALLVSAELGRRLLAKLGVRISPDTLLRCAKAAPSCEPETPPRVIGIDDWALRKGHSYGTIVVDHERKMPLGLLPNRDGSKLQAWLERHPSIEVITRDRANAYAEACTWGAPQAEQVLDRWHLLKNLFEAFEKGIARAYGAIRAAARELSSPQENQVAVVPAPSRSHKGEERERRWTRRLARFRAVKEKLALGWSVSRVARELNLSRATVYKYRELEELPDPGNRRKRGSQLDPFKRFLTDRYLEGCQNAALLYREVRRQGYAGGRTLVRDFVQGLREAAPAASKPKTRLPATRSLAWWLLLPERLPEERREWLGEVMAALPHLTEIVNLARWGWSALRDRQQQSFTAWLAAALEHGSPELRNYAKGLDLDSRATANALTFDWSNGPTEGQVNRLKFIKRSMYGRAGFDLLAAKVLYTA